MGKEEVQFCITFVYSYVLYVCIFLHKDVYLCDTLEISVFN